MTEKRFVGRYAGRNIKKLIGIEDIETNRVCVTIEENIRLLNELADENEQLKQLIKETLEITPIEHSLAVKLKNSIREMYE